MKTVTAQDTYSKLVSDISLIYEKARLNFIQMYWNIGRYVDKFENNRSFKAIFGQHLVDQLSKDLSEKYGKGFSSTNLKNMRLFFKTYSLRQISDGLEWSNYVALLTVKDPGKRQDLEQRIINERLTNFQLRRLIATQHLSEKMKDAKNQDSFQLKGDRGLLYTYTLIDPSRIAGSDVAIVVDCGFNVWKSILVKNDKEFTDEKFITSKKNKTSFNIKPAEGISSSQIYTFKAYIEKIVDGDTFWAIVDCGFYTCVRQKLRLRGIDVPEINTQEGKKAKSFVSRVLKDCSFVVIKTHKSDKYDRYLSDIFYLPAEKDIDKINQDGIFLNQELLDKGMAVIM